MIEELEYDEIKKIIIDAAIFNLVYAKISARSEDEKIEIAKARFKCMQEIQALEKNEEVTEEEKKNFPLKIMKILEDNKVHLKEPTIFQDMLRMFVSLTKIFSFPENIANKLNKITAKADEWAKNSDKDFIDEVKMHTTRKKKPGR